MSLDIITALCWALIVILIALPMAAISWSISQAERTGRNFSSARKDI